MTESQLFLEWTADARREGEVKARCELLLELLDSRFPGTLPADVRDLIAKQDSQQMLNDWFKAALKAFSIDSFRAHVLR